MVSFKKLFALGAGLANLVNAVPAPAPGDVSLSARAAAAEPVVPSFDVGHLEKRDRGRMTLQWSPQGRFMFLLGANLPLALEHIYTEGKGQGGIAQALLREFWNWIEIETNHGTVDPNGVTRATNLLIHDAREGSVYGRQGFGTIGDYGFAFITTYTPSAEQLQDVVDTIRTWATQGGGVIEVVQRANDFFNPAQIGAGTVLERRFRNDKCVKAESILKYAERDVAIDIDFNKMVRWAGTCDPQ